MRLRSLAFVVSFIALSATARAQEWANYGTISAEPTAGRICSGDANGKDILCASPAPYVDPATGNVGIGTDVPLTILHVIRDQDASTDLAITNSSTGTNAQSALSLNAAVGGAALTAFGSGNMGTTYARANGVSLYTSSASTGGLSLAARNASGYITLHSGGNTERMRIDSSGKVGIGDATPDHTLDVAGNIGLNASGYINWGDTDGTSGYGLRDNAGAIEYKNSGGSWTAMNAGTATNFAAGTVSAPGLYVTGDSNTGLYQATADSVSITAGGVEAARFNTATSGVNYLAVTPSATTAAVQLAAAGTDSNISLAIMPKGTGNVGIGTASPGFKLDVTGTLRTTGAVYNDGSAQYINAAGSSPSGHAPVSIFRRARNTIASPQAVQSGDFLGALEFGGHNGTAWADGWNGGTIIRSLAEENWAVGAMGAHLAFGTTPIGAASAVERMRIDASGKVGIGTTAPAAKLDVVGTIKVADASDTCSVAADLGKFRYNTSTGRFQICK